MPKVTPSVADDADRCARDLLEVVPLASRWLRSAVRRREPTWSLPQLMAMGYLRLKPDASLSDLANHLGVGLPTASTLVSRLVSVNHVDRRDDPAERRRALLRLTSKGERQLDAALVDTEAELAERLRTLRPRELTHLRQGLAVLHTVFGDA